VLLEGYRFCAWDLSLSIPDGSTVTYLLAASFENGIVNMGPWLILTKENIDQYDF
jgi:hypothetical protein